ncbi:MAG TPA: HAMP domain-containing sensor histidine kinase [Ktedonobacteraceae bacterium]
MWLRKGGMVREAGILALLEQCRQLLECQVAYFIPGCGDQMLRHPLLDLVSENSWQIFYRGDVSATRVRLAGLRMEEPVLATCDLAMQSGRMQALKIGGRLAKHWRLQSIAALPLERPAGILGTFLLADGCAEKFGPGERLLMYAFLSMCGTAMERALWGLAGEVMRGASKPVAHAQREKEQPAQEREQFGPSEFVSVVGHELRAPLSIIKGYAGLLQAYGGTVEDLAPALTPERQRHYLDVVMEQTDLLELLVNDLLDMARLQRGKLTLRPRVVDVGALCQRVVQLGQLRADQREPGKYQLECRISARLPPLLADAERLQQVLMNLVENAIKYSPEGGRIALEAGLVEGREWPSQRSGEQYGQEQARVQFVVRDKGIGIPARYSTRLFQPFERLGQTATSLIPGMGLGLYITHQLIEAMGGTIEVYSCEGSGTDVTITLPAVSPNKAEVPEKVVQMHSLPMS